MMQQLLLGSKLDKVTLEGQILDLKKGRFFPGRIHIKDSKILSVEEAAVSSTDIIIPPLVDSHIHVESSLMPPAELGRSLLPNGVFATISDPHEIANVLGIKGVEFMIDDSKRTDCCIIFGAPSCVPATHESMETAGARFGVSEVAHLLAKKEIRYLAEVMNYPGVLAGDQNFIDMISTAKSFGKPVDGHAPRLTGEDAIKYAAAGISTDHECVSFEEARFKLVEAGQKILVREGSAARNLEDLAQIIADYSDMSMLCSDDLHPDLAIGGSINRHVARLIKMGLDPVDVLKAASANPVRHYGLPIGQLQAGDSADFLIIKDLKDFYVQTAIKAGRVVAVDGKGLENHSSAPIINNFKALPIQESDLRVPATGNQVRCIGVIDGQLVTDSLVEKAKIINGEVVADKERDILKLVVLNRYKPSAPSVGFVKNFGLKQGALASSVAHDSHNIVAVGVDDTAIAEAINQVIQHKGGLVYADSQYANILPLPIAGLMSDEPVEKVSADYISLDNVAKQRGGTNLSAPFMTLSFLALIVIPKLKLSDKGLFEDFVKVPVVFNE